LPVRLWLLSDRARVLVLVRDADPRLPVRIDADELAESGRGLQLVKAITTQWDAYATPQAGGKVVRAVIAAELPRDRRVDDVGGWAVRP